MLRKEGRLASELRPTVITKNVQEFAEGSVMISTGKTQVLCAVSVVEESLDSSKAPDVGG